MVKRKGTKRQTMVERKETKRQTMVERKGTKRQTMVERKVCGPLFVLSPDKDSVCSKRVTTEIL
jgi:hypothetical protein